MRTLLSYLWEHRGKSVSEYAIAVDALGRPPDFDPKSDAYVRVQIARLRSKLNEFYDREKEPSLVRLTIPLGGHEVISVLSPRATSGTVTFRALPPLYRNLLLASLVVVPVLSLLCVVLALGNRTPKASMSASASAPLRQLPRFWQSFLVGNTVPAVVVPCPLFFRWSTHNNIFVRDVDVGQFQDWPQSPFLRQLADKWGEPTLTQHYIHESQVRAAVTIMEYLASRGQHSELAYSTNLATDSVSVRNAIFLGPPRLYTAGDLVKQIYEQTNFYAAGLEPAVIGNRSPRPGEAREYREVDYSTEHRVLPELVTLLPARANGTRSLVLTGAAASILLSTEGLKLLDEKWKAGGSPDSWQMVFQVELNGDIVVRIRPITIREIPVTFWK
jgi:hypothetical protein